MFSMQWQSIYFIISNRLYQYVSRLQEMTVFVSESFIDTTDLFNDSWVIESFTLKQKHWFIEERNS